MILGVRVGGRLRFRLVDGLVDDLVYGLAARFGVI